MSSARKWEAITDLDVSRGNRDDDEWGGGGSEGGTSLDTGVLFVWHYFPWAAGTNHYHPSILNTAGLSSLLLWWPHVQNRSVSPATVPQKLQGRTLPRFSSSQRWLTTSDSPWLGVASRQHLPPSPFGLLCSPPIILFLSGHLV